MATKKNVSDTGLAVLYYAIKSALDPLWPSICENFDEIYGVKERDAIENSDSPDLLSARLCVASDVVYEYEMRSRDRES